MKSTEYLVKYVNGKEEYFYCMGFQEAIVRALNWAYDKALDWRIESITDEHGVKIIEPKLTYTQI